VEPYPRNQSESWGRPPVKSRQSLGAKSYDSFATWSYMTLFLLASSGYPLAGTLTSLLTPGTQTISFGFRWLVVALSVLVLVQSFLSQKQRLFPPILLVFFACCVARMYYDNFVAYIPQADKVGLYFVGTVLPPALVLGVCYPNYDKEKLPIAMFVLSASICFLVTLMNEFQLAGAANMSEALGRLFFESLNATQIGYAAVFAIFSGLLIWKGSPFWLKMAILAAAANSLYLLGLAAARGPVVALVLGFAYLAWTRRSFALLAFLIILGAIAALWLSDSSLLIFDRFTTFGADESSDERIITMVQSWNSALENPLVGLAYVDPAVMFYPHNFTIESGLALGIVGFLLMVYIQIRLFFLSDWLGKTGDKMLGIFVIAILTGANLSGSIWQSTDFWMVTALAFGLASNRVVRARPRVLNA
jgi:hypothetical protein